MDVKDIILGETLRVVCVHVAPRMILWASLAVYINLDR